MFLSLFLFCFCLFRVHPHSDSDTVFRTMKLVTQQGTEQFDSVRFWVQSAENQKRESIPHCRQTQTFLVLPNFLNKLWKSISCLYTAIMREQIHAANVRSAAEYRLPFRSAQTCLKTSAILKWNRKSSLVWADWRRVLWTSPNKDIMNQSLDAYGWVISHYSVFIPE